jgi:hypothetical protein
MSLFSSGPKNVNIIPKGKAIPAGYKLAIITEDKIKPTPENIKNFNNKNYYRLDGNNTPKRVTAEIGEIGDDGIKQIDVYDTDNYYLGPLNPKYSITSVTILEKVSKGGKSRKQKRGGRKSRKNRRSRKSM